MTTIHPAPAVTGQAGESAPKGTDPGLREALDRIVLDAFDFNDECRYCEVVHGDEEHQDWCPAQIAEAALRSPAQNGGEQG